MKFILILFECSEHDSEQSDKVHMVLSNGAQKLPDKFNLTNLIKISQR